MKRRQGTEARKAESYRGARREVMRKAKQLRYWKLPENQKARLLGVTFYTGCTPLRPEAQKRAERKAARAIRKEYFPHQEMQEKSRRLRQLKKGAI